MSSSTVFSTAILATILLVSSTMGHSQMRCAKYNTKTGECYAPIRNAGESFIQEAYDMTTGSKGLCQSAWTNPITAAYANGAGCPNYDVASSCPLGMGTYYPGENFYVQWVARNHATSEQTPGNVTLYLSPAESVNQGSDVSASVFANNKFCVAPFISCNGKNGDLVNCSAPCTMPSNTQPGLYTLWWKWVWPGHTSVYSTCADIWVVAGGSNAPSTPSTPSVPATPTQPSPAPSTPTQPSPPAVPSTTGAKSSPAAPSTTGSKASSAPSTTGKSASNLPSGSCTSGFMKCLTSETYSKCNGGSWGPEQSCKFGETCSPSGDYIYCKPSTSTPTPVTPTPVPSTPVPTPTQPSSSSSSSCTTQGDQRCTGSNSYQTCGNGNNGNAWSADQFCQAGLSCHASSNSQKIYCY